MTSTTKPSVFCWKNRISEINWLRAVFWLGGDIVGMRMNPIVFGPTGNVPETNWSVDLDPRRSAKPEGGLNLGGGLPKGNRPTEERFAAGARACPYSCWISACM